MEISMDKEGSCRHVRRSGLFRGCLAFKKQGYDVSRGNDADLAG